MLYYEYTRAEWQFSRATRVTGVDVLIISGRRSILNKQKREKGKLEKRRGEMAAVAPQ